MDNPVRLGLIGCGIIVQISHSHGFLAIPETVKVVAISDLVEGNRAWGGDVFDVPKDQQYAGYQEMLERAELDAVSIATPHSVHAEQAIAAAKAGVAVISEKPMATTLEDADAILDAVECNGVPYSVVHNMQFSYSMEEALKQLAEMPDPFMGRTSGMGLKPPDFSSSHRNPAFAWRASKATGGGCIIDSAYHEIYCLQALMRSPIRYVEARVKTLRLEIDVDDVALLLCEHDNGAVSTVSRSWCAPKTDGGPWCEVHTTEGSIWVENRKSGPTSLKRSDARGKWKQVSLPDGGENVNNHGRFFKATFEALSSGSALPVTGYEARHNLAIIEAARKATEARKAIDLRDLRRS